MIRQNATWNENGDPVAVVRQLRSRDGQRYTKRMCGFVGWYSFANQAPLERGTLGAATNLLAHRGPNDEAYYHSSRFAAGFRRLSILDLSDRGRQPMSDQRGRYWLVFNGEIYNYRELRKELAQKGWTF